MVDTSTKQPLHVSTDGDAVPYIMVPVQQVDDVCTLLDAHDVRYWRDELAISLNGKPEVTVVNLGHRSDAANVQQILDNASEN